MKIAFHTLGCKVNQYETEALKENFKSKGHEITTDDSIADVYIINTCTVTSLADRKSRQYIRRAKKLNSQSIIAVTGCYAEVSPEEAASIDGVDLVIGNEDKMNIPEQLEKFFSNCRFAEADILLKNTEVVSERKESAGDEETPLQNINEAGYFAKLDSRTRAFIKVQDGCDRFCSYCIIPYARGKVRSRPLESIVSEAKNLIDNGFKEIVLTGINTALYGVESSFSVGIESVIKELNALSGDFRIRLSSLEPTVIDANYIQKLFKYEKLCHHIHLSLQSGSDKILKSMNRRYSIDEYMQIIKVLTEFDSEYGISTDIIVGFPGESEEDFNMSRNLIDIVDFCKVHVFKYSSRKGTASAKMGGQIHGGEKSRRSAILLEAERISSERFFEKNLGKTNRVLIEEYIKKLGCYTGYSDNYIKLYIEKKYLKDTHINEFVDVKLIEVFKDGMLAEPV